MRQPGGFRGSVCRSTSPLQQSFDDCARGRLLEGFVHVGCRPLGVAIECLAVGAGTAHSRGTARSQEGIKYFGDEGGNIINISSIASTYAPPNASVYSATKGAVDHEVAVQGARTARDPHQRHQSRHGGNRGRARRGDYRDIRTQIEAQTPLGRIGQPPDIATAAIFLASPASSWITGEMLTIADGLQVARGVKPDVILRADGPLLGRGAQSLGAAVRRRWAYHPESAGRPGESFRAPVRARPKAGKRQQIDSAEQATFIDKPLDSMIRPDVSARMPALPLYGLL
ncbi:MAG: SDR family oxidoreductase [Chromatiales bacterium]